MPDCQKCGGAIPYGSFGNVRCEYCSTVNYVPLPQEGQAEVRISAPQPTPPPQEEEPKEEEPEEEEKPEEKEEPEKEEHKSEVKKRKSTQLKRLRKEVRGRLKMLIYLVLIVAVLIIGYTMYVDSMSSSPGPVSTVGSPSTTQEPLFIILSENIAIQAEEMKDVLSRNLI